MSNAARKTTETKTAVEVLDGWAFCHPGHSFHTELDPGGLWVCHARNVSDYYVGKTPDEAREKAAAAVLAGKV